MFIYKITNLINDKIYIGKTIRSVQERFREHCSMAQHNYCESSHLYNAMRQYGVENFKVEVLEECTSEDLLNERERYYISILHSQRPSIGYNIHEGGKGGNTHSEGYKPTSKQLDALEEGRRLQASSLQKAQLRERRTACVVSKETREKLREKASGKHPSEETREKMRKSHLNLPKNLHTEEEKEKCRLQSLDRVHIHKGTLNKNPKKSEVDIYLNDGWELGYFYKS